MGISGLLPFVKKASREINVSFFAGQTVAVDAYCWLHKGAFSCAEKLVKGEPTDGYVYYVIKMVTMLLRAGVIPILVFDGQNLPSKKATEMKRRENREKNRKKAKEYLREGKVREARECFQRCIDITPQMARETILACRAKGVDCLVAPYEADAQLAYLCKTGIAQLVITEDSDLIIFGCQKILFKMDSGGQGVLVEQSKLHECLGLRAESFTFDRFRYTCILSGCDYLESLPGIGLVKASKFFSLSSNPNLEQSLSRIPSYLRMPKLVVSSEYKKSFVKANNTFLHQVVFCPLKKKLVPLNPYLEDIDPAELEYAGRYFANDLAMDMAKGNINVSTLQPFTDPIGTPKQKKVPQKHHNWHVSDVPESIWSSKYEIKNRKSVEIEKATVPSTAGRVISVNVPKSLLPNAKKRKAEPEVPVISGPSDQELLNIYGAIDQEQNLEFSPDKQPSVFVHERSPLLERNSEIKNEPDCNVSDRKRIFMKNEIESSSPTPVVRSRFFWTSNEGNSACNKSSSLWDKLEERVPSENTPPQNKPTQMAFSKSWPTEVSLLQNSPKVSKPFKPITTSVPESNNINHETQATSQEIEDSILSQKSFSSESENMEQLSVSQLCNNDDEEPFSQKTENLSQLTVCSMDRESFDLSQSSQTSFSRSSEGAEQVRSKPLCRKIGLSKKRQGTTLTGGQLSLKQAFEKFRFKK